MSKPVTEYDLRQKEFQHPDIKPDQYEFRGDGALVRKDRWETGIRNIASIFGLQRESWEVEEIVQLVRSKLRVWTADIDELPPVGLDVYCYFVKNNSRQQKVMCINADGEWQGENDLNPKGENVTHWAFMLEEPEDT